jgi:hypothetical protein
MARAKNPNREALRRLVENLPRSLWGRWMDAGEIHEHLKQGGFPELPRPLLSRCLRRTETSMLMRKDSYSNNAWYIFGDQDTLDRSPNCYRAQRDEATTPSFCLQDGFFLQPELDAVVSAAVEVLLAAGYGERRAAVTPDLKRRASLAGQTPTTSLECRTPFADRSNAQSNSSPETDHPVAAAVVAESAILPNNDEKMSLRIVDDFVDNQFVQQLTLHNRSCDGDLKITNDRKLGYDSCRTYRCFKCDTFIFRRTGRDVVETETNKTPGQKKSQLNVLLEESRLEAGISVRKGNECFNSAGIMCPGPSESRKERDKLLIHCASISEDQLRENRCKHVEATRQLPNYIGDVIITGDNGDTRRIAQGKIAMDGAGATRAYNHRITGDQHIFAIFSCVLQLPLYVKVDQTSCTRCSRKVTKYMLEKNIKAVDIAAGEINFEHEGPCSRNSKHSPAVAEEYAAEAAGKFLAELPDDEAIFGYRVVSDGDTRGTTKFIASQVKVLGEEISGLAEHEPDIGHFLKTISNAMYILCDKDRTMKGKQLLETPRIRAITSDVKKHIDTYHDCIVDLQEKESTIMAQQGLTARKDVARNVCLKALTSIARHHSGDHSKCTDVHCKYLKIEAEVAKTNDRSDCEFDVIVAQRYAKEARFKGKIMSLHEGGIEKLTEVITSRANEKNIDRIAAMGSSNPCEGFFGCLTKQTEGKRIHFSKNLGNIVALVAGSQSNKAFGNRILAEGGVEVAKIASRDTHQIKKKNRLEKEKERRRSEPCKQRRMASRQFKLVKLDRDGNSASRHKTDKMHPTDNCKVMSSSKPATKSLRKCSNCGISGHTKKDCAKPTYTSTNTSKRRAKHSSVDNKGAMLRFFNVK